MSQLSGGGTLRKGSKIPTSAGSSSISRSTVIGRQAISVRTPLRNRCSSAGGRQSTGRWTTPNHNDRNSFNGAHPVLGSIVKKGLVGSVKRMSTAPRRSSTYGRYGHEILKEPRPTNTKAFKEKSIRELIHFLVSNGYPHQLTQKMLLIPLARDFYNIFEFMFRFFEPKFKLGKKQDQEVLMVFRLLHYPFQISKSTMASIGSPHTWPALLGAITWMRELIQGMVVQDVEAGLLTTGDFGDATPDNYFFTFAETTYNQFITSGNGQVTYEKDEQQLADNIRNCGELADLDHMLSEHKLAKEELVFVRNQPDQLNAEKEKFDCISLDLQKMLEYGRSLDEHSSNNQDMVNQQEKELARAEMELNALQQDIERKRQLIARQEMSVSDGRQLEVDRKTIQDSMDSSKSEIDNSDKQFWSIEIAMAKEKQRIDHTVSKYNQHARELGLIPSTAENAAGHNYELTGKVTKFTDESTRSMQIIKPGLLNLKKRMKMSVNKCTEEWFTANESLNHMTEIVAEKEKSIHLLNNKMKRIDETIMSIKQTSNKEQHDMREKIDEQQDRLSELRTNYMVSIEDDQRQLEEKQRQALQDANKLCSESDAYKSFLVKVMELVIDHKAKIQDQAEKDLNMVKNAYNEDMDKLRSLGCDVGPDLL